MVRFRGLIRRRAAESLLFQGIIDANYDGEPDAVQPVSIQPPAPTSRVESPEGEAPPVAAPTALPMPQQVEPPPVLKELKPMSKSSISWASIGNWFTTHFAFVGVIWEKLTTPEGLIIFGVFSLAVTTFTVMVIKGRIDIGKMWAAMTSDQARA